MSGGSATEYYVSADEIAAIPLAVLRDVEGGATENPWRLLDAEREAASRTQSWPTYAFAPRSAFVRAAVRASGQTRGKDALRALTDLEVIAPWRVTRGIYCFDETLSEALADTSAATEIPIDVLTRLPEWAVCIFGSRLSPDGHVICAFAALVYDDRSDDLALKIMVVHPDGSRSSAGMTLTPGMTIESGLDATIAASQAAGFLDEEMAAVASRRGIVTETLASVIAHLLYLCADGPDMDAAPPRPQPTKTKAGARFFPPAEGSRIVPVGARFGAMFRRVTSEYARQSESAKTARRMPPHWRKAHWAHYWVGPRNAPSRTQVLRWIAPTFVNPVDDDVTVTVRPVR